MECNIDSFIPMGDREWTITRIEGCHYQDKIFWKRDPDLKNQETPIYITKSTYLKLNYHVKNR